MTTVHQWDIVKVRINPDDSDEHPAIILSPDEICGDPRRNRLNALYGTTRRPASPPQPHDVQLNSADGLEHATLFACSTIYLIDRGKITCVLGRVSPERRRQIGRKIVSTFRLPLS